MFGTTKIDNTRATDDATKEAMNAALVVEKRKRALDAATKALELFESEIPDADVAYYNTVTGRAYIRPKMKKADK